ncbi:MAG: hypothetical protein LUG98_02365 [Tannerellaceae bacterium]|nr:hypothetical protein [Tannerellaceae bacterium]
MIKRLYTLLILLCSTALIWAQDYDNRGDVFIPKKGQWQVSLVLGNGTFYNENTTNYLLPQYSNTGGSIGLPNGSGETSGDLGTYLNLGSLNNNSLVNIAGIQGKYFVTDRWDINVMFSMNISVTPKKDFVEGDYMVEDLVIPSQKYINAQMTNNWMATIGSNYYSRTGNERINPYLGGAAGFQMARIEINQPYTGEVYEDEKGALPTQVYIASGKAGQMFGFKVAAVAGIEYTLTKGLLLGFELHPFAYRYDVIQLCPKGFDTYRANHHNIKLLEMPVLKLGMRF